jgi:transcriptional regulator with XRE-family HTH domain
MAGSGLTDLADDAQNSHSASNVYLSVSGPERYNTLMQITPDQFRAVRSLLRLDQAEVAQRAHVSVITIRRLEGSDGGERVTPATLDSVRTVLERAGAEFIPEGVRRRRAIGPDADSLYADLRAISLRSRARLRAGDQLTDADLYDDEGLPA